MPGNPSRSTPAALCHSPRTQLWRQPPAILSVGHAWLRPEPSPPPRQENARPRVPTPGDQHRGSRPGLSLGGRPEGQNATPYSNTSR
eukprot:6794324-Lingulodinium_polyedra.AAC.1